MDTDLDASEIHTSWTLSYSDGFPEMMMSSAVVYALFLKMIVDRVIETGREKSIMSFKLTLSRWPAFHEIHKNSNDAKVISLITVEMLMTVICDASQSWKMSAATDAAKIAEEAKQKPKYGFIVDYEELD